MPSDSIIPGDGKKDFADSSRSDVAVVVVILPEPNASSQSPETSFIAERRTTD
jgi:hypothetical protein